jgi:hypothetical protein
MRSSRPASAVRRCSTTTTSDFLVRASTSSTENATTPFGGGSATSVDDALDVGRVELAAHLDDELLVTAGEEQAPVHARRRGLP